MMLTPRARASARTGWSGLTAAEASHGGPEDGRKYKAEITKRALTAVGMCIDPFQTDHRECYELAFRGIEHSRSVISKSGQDFHKNLLLSDELLEDREKSKRVQGLAHELLKIKNLAIPSEGVIAHLAESGWNDVEFGKAWKVYLDAVFSPQDGKSTITQKREALKAFFEFKRGIEPKPEAGEELDLDSMPDHELKAVQRQLVRAMLEEESPRRLLETPNVRPHEQEPDGTREG